MQYTVLKNFLTSSDIDTLQYLVKILPPFAQWDEGRQGTGYKKYNIKHFSTLSAIQEKISLVTGHTLSSDLWDCYFLYYPDGSFIPKHVDEATMFGKRHTRLNVLIVSPQSGGDLYVDGQLVNLTVGDAIHFWPDKQEHEVTKVKGNRLLLSSGAWV